MIDQIRVNMPVLDARGTPIGRVAGAPTGNEIPLVRADVAGLYHFIPIDWVAEVGRSVVLKKTAVDVTGDRR